MKPTQTKESETKMASMFEDYKQHMLEVKKHLPGMVDEMKKLHPEADVGKFTDMVGLYEYQLSGLDQKLIQMYLRKIVELHPELETDEWTLLHKLTYAKEWVPVTVLN